jgi:hypothetical protein
MPNWEHAFVEPAKVRDYLLDPAHRDGASKARYFMRLGYRREAWAELQNDLVTQLSPLDVDAVQRRQDGVLYVIVGRLAGPHGSGTILSVWMLERDEERPRLVTAYPSPR